MVVILDSVVSAFEGLFFYQEGYEKNLFLALAIFGFGTRIGAMAYITVIDAD
jgi:hypothetical protein